MRVEQQGLTLKVWCRCGRPMLFSIGIYVCLARVWWNAFLHDKQITYAKARKVIDR